MTDTFTYIGQRFAKGLREAPREFVAPIIVAVRGAKVAAQFVSRQLDTAMNEAREKADRNVIK
jgi:6,7-dimethyl-8-ribityllumazine synthase